MIPISLADFALAIGAALPLSLRGDHMVKTVVTDTRALTPGAVFVALRGERFDGHQFLRQAAERGAVAAVTARDAGMAAAAIAAALPLLQVDDTLLALGQLGLLVRERSQAWVCGITGSVGKTTARTMAAAALGPEGAVLQSRANENNEVGVPLTLLALEPQHRAAVVEMGMRAKGEIKYLSRITRPDAAAITRIGTAHIGRLGSQEAIARAKAEIFQHLKPGGAAVLPRDDAFYPFLAARRKRVLSFGLSNLADVHAHTVEDRGLAGARLDVATPSGTVVLELRTGGHAMIQNALLALAVCHAAGHDLEDAAARLREYEPMRGRGATLARHGRKVIDDAYNASPESMRAALGMMRRTPGYARRVAVLGDMLEQGEFAPDYHREVGEAAAAAGLHRLVCVGPQSRAMADEALRRGMQPQAVVWYEDSQAAANAVADWATDADLILVKGSNGTRMDRILDGLAAWDPAPGAGADE